VSPGGHITFELRAAGAGSLEYRIRRDGVPVLEWSALGIVVDDANAAAGAELSDALVCSRTDADYPTRGVHARARDLSGDCTLAMHDRAGRFQLSIDVRIFEDGVGFRFFVPGAGTRTPDEATTFVLPKGSTTWSNDLHMHYESQYVRRAIEDVPAGDWAALPMTYKLAGDGGYASITEAALTGYAGMALQADGRGGYAARLGHAQPVSYPYALRYSAEDVQRLSKPASIAGEIRTPWRVVIAARDLNGLVNSDIVHDLNPPPDPALFPQGLDTPWIKPGRAVWRYLDGGDNTYEGLEHFTALAAELGFEYHVVEGTWRQWTPERLKAFVDDAAAKHVGVLLWQHSRDLRTAEQRRAFFEMCRRNGVAGAKIDFFDHEAKEVIDLYSALLREAAQYHLVLDFHGADKPTGLDRTWPNELTREAVLGFEHRGAWPWGPHNTTLPFTRMLAGGADYTPTVFGERRRETSVAHQIATAVVFTSPLLVFGGHPQSLLDSPASAIIKAIPATWDETIVLPPSAIGEVAVFARRTGRTWFIAAINAAGTRTVTLTPSFLGSGRFTAAVARDDMTNPAAISVDTLPLSAATPLTFELRDGGGFVARVTPGGS